MTTQETTGPAPSPDDWNHQKALPELQRELGSRYQDFHFVGRGGMGIVYRADHRVLHRPVAVKVILPGRSSDRFLRECRILASINCPKVVTVYESEVLSTGLPVLIMEWIDGASLAEVIRDNGGKIHEERAVVWMRDVCEGMSAVSSENVIHRDLKPSNILIDRGGTARVADFGLARDLLHSTQDSLSHGLLGSPYYMSPEQAESPRRADIRSDIYGFGATFYHALTGVPLFQGDSAFAVLFKHKTEPVIPPMSRNPEISPWLNDLIERCLAKAPENRFRSFDEIAELLRPAAQPARLKSPWDFRTDALLAKSMRRFEKNRAKYIAGQAIFDEVYEFRSGRELRIISGDIRVQPVEAIVSSDDELLSMSGGVSAAIASSAGQQIRVEAKRLAPARQGRAVVTSGGDLPMRFVFHGVTLDYSRPEVLLPSRDIIAEILDSCFYHAESLNVRSLAFPLLGTGAGGFSREVCLDTMFRVLARMLLRRPTCVRSARIVICGDQDPR